MGILGTNYNKEGKGVEKSTGEKRRFFIFFEEYGRKFFGLLKVNFIYFLIVLPTIAGVVLTGNDKLKAIGIILLAIGLFTFGPATAALTYVIRNYVMQRHVWLISDFKEQFKKNYKQSLIIGIADILFPVILYNAFIYYASLGGIFTVVAGGLVVFAAAIFFIMNFYIYPMIVTFDLKLSHIIKNSLLFAIVKFPVNLFILIVDGSIIYYFGEQILSGWLGLVIAAMCLSTIMLSTVGFITVFTVWKYIEDAMIEEDDNKEESVFSDSLK